MEKARLSAYLLPDTKTKLAAAANERGRSVGSVIDDLVTLYLADYLRTGDDEA